MVRLVKTAALLAFLTTCPAHAFASLQAPPVRFEIRLAQLDADKNLVEALLPEGVRAYLQRTPLITNEDIVEARAIRDGDCDGRDGFGLRLLFTRAAAARLAETTQAPEGELLAFLIDGKVVSLAALDFTIRDAIAVHLNLTGEQAGRIVDALNHK